MPTYFIDTELGNDALDGLSFANRWKTLTNGATAARIAPGDTIRIKASPYPTSLGQTATWTNKSRVVTLTSAVTANISTCETAWTQSANVTATASSTAKEGTNAASIVIAAGFTTGLAAYFPLGAATDFSAYQQVSFWYYNSLISANNATLRLCSDAAGVTAVNIIPIPQAAVASTWTQVTFDNGAALGNSIQSVALYIETDNGAQTIFLDNIIACKAPSAADSLTLRSLISKGTTNEPWWAIKSINGTQVQLSPVEAVNVGRGYDGTTESVTTYKREAVYQNLPILVSGATNATPIVITTSAAHNLTNKSIVTIDAVGGNTAANGTFRTTWLSTTTFSLQNVSSGADIAGNGTYTSGGTVHIQSITNNHVTAAAVVGSITDSGTVGNLITYQGGWDRTNMSQLATVANGFAAGSDETWFDGGSQDGYGIHMTGKSYNSIDRIGCVRYASGYYLTGTSQFNQFPYIPGITGCDGPGLQMDSTSHFNTFTLIGGLVTNGGGISLSGCNNTVMTSITSVSSNTATNAFYVTGSSNCQFPSILRINNNSNIGLALETAQCNFNEFTYIGQINDNAGIGLSLGICHNNNFRNLPNILNNTYGVSFAGASCWYNNLYNPTFGGNTSGSVNVVAGHNYIFNGLFPEGTEFATLTAFNNARVTSVKHDKTADNHYIAMDGGTILSSTTRHTGTGISWQYYVQHSNRDVNYPLTQTFARVAVNANALVTASVWALRTGTGIIGKLRVRGNQIAGVTNDVVDTIVQSGGQHGGGITGATNATPIVITTSTEHGLNDGQTVTIGSVGGNTAANGTWAVTLISPTTFSLDTSVGNGTYTSGGTVTSVLSTWEKLVVTFTPTEKGVVEFEGIAYYNGNTTQSVVYDDFAVSQA